MAGKTCMVYITAGGRNGTIYTGVTSDPAGRMWQHREKVFPHSFSARYDCTQLVWYEVHEDIEAAIQREKRIKNWHRRWKLKLVEDFNPSWRDLSADVGL